MGKAPLAEARTPLAVPLAEGEMEVVCRELWVELPPLGVKVEPRVRAGVLVGAVSVGVTAIVTVDL